VTWMKRRFLILILLATANSSLVRGQGFTASILGTVTDNTGAVVPQAVITVTNQATRQKVSAISGADGEYTVPLLPPGNYSVTVEAPGFKRALQEPVKLDVDLRQRLDFKLELGEVTESVKGGGQHRASPNRDCLGWRSRDDGTNIGASAEWQSIPAVEPAGPWRAVDCKRFQSFWRRRFD
jgi:hypothetical protein